MAKGTNYPHNALYLMKETFVLGYLQPYCHGWWDNESQWLCRGHVLDILSEL